MRLIDADALVKRLEKSHEYHAKPRREEWSSHEKYNNGFRSLL